MIHILHFSRYMSSQTFTNEDTSTEYSIDDGWYNLPELLYYLENTHSESLKYDSETNRVTQSGTISYSMTTGVSVLLGWETTAGTSAARAPQATWQAECGLIRMGNNNGDGVRRIGTVEHRTQDGTVFTLSSGEMRIDEFDFRLVDREVCESASEDADFTATIEEVIAPSLGIRFVKMESESYSSLDLDYSAALTWIGTEWILSNFEDFQKSLQKRVQEYDNYWDFRLPVIYQGTGDPA